MLIENSYIQQIRNAAASISLPVDAILRANGSADSTVVFLVYDKPAFFQPKGKLELNGKVVSAEVGNYVRPVKDFSDPVIVSIKQKERRPSTCKWWDFTKSGGRGGWTTEGCSLSKVKGNVCCVSL